MRFVFCLAVIQILEVAPETGAPAGVEAASIEIWDYG